MERCQDKRLKLNTIAAIVEEEDSPEIDLWRQLATIDENLIRRTLSAAQRAKLIKERKAVYLKVHPETEHGAAPAKRGGKGGKKTSGGKDANSASLPFTEDTAKKTGRSRRSVEIDAARGKALGDDLARIAGTSLDKGSELDALVGLSPEQRAPLIERAIAGETPATVTALAEMGKKVRAVPPDDFRGPSCAMHFGLDVDQRLKILARKFPVDASSQRVKSDRRVSVANYAIDNCLIGRKIAEISPYLFFVAASLGKSAYGKGRPQMGATRQIRSSGNWSDPMEDHPADKTPKDPATTEPTALELWDRQAVLEYFGGNKPLHPSTLYRGMAARIYPRPINVSVNVVRWVADECRAATQRMLAARDEPKQPTGRGRKRRQGDEPPMKPRPMPTR